MRNVRERVRKELLRTLLRKKTLEIRRDMKKKNRITIKNVHDFNYVAQDIIDCWLEDFTERQGLTREPNQEDYHDFGHEDVSFMYTQKGMRLYDRACNKLKELGEKTFPNEPQNVLVKSGIMLFP